VRTSSKVSLANKTTNATSHGRTTMLPKILILLSAISLNSISLRIESRMFSMSLITNSPYRVRSPSTPEDRELEEELLAPSRKKGSSKSLCLNLEPSRKDKFLLLSSEDTTIEVTFPSELTTKTLSPNSHGKSRLNHSIIITICQSFSMEPDKSTTLIEPLQF